MGWYTKEELRAMGKWDDDPQPLKAFTDVEAKRPTFRKVVLITLRT